MLPLKLDNVGLRHNGRWVLWDVSLEVVPGEIITVFGRSGSGKTSLARILGGLVKPARGSITSDGEDVRASLAFETPALVPELTVTDNLAMFASLWKISLRSRAKRIAFLLELIGLADRRSERYARLSLGEAKRVEIVRALVADSPLTVIDSLLDDLDSVTLEKLWDYMLTQCREREVSFVVMTRSARIGALGSRIAVLHKGRVIFSGRPDDFRRLGGEDVIVLSELPSPALRKRIEERLSVVIREEDGFLSFRVTDGEKIIGDLLAEFGSDVGCVYLKRPTLDDALDMLLSGSPAVSARV